jgi:hypothetical protein
MRGVQYAAAYRCNRWRLWNTGSSAGACHRARRRRDPVADDDSWCVQDTVSRSRGAIRPGLAGNFRPEISRACGMPGARCTRSPVCEDGGKNAHEYSQRSHRNHPASRTQWFTAYSALSPVTGLFCHRHRRNRFRRLDASVGASGPHVFAVRFGLVRPRDLHVHRIPFQRS